MKLVTPATVERNTVEAPQQNNLKLLPAVIPPKVAGDQPADKFDWSSAELVVLHRQPAIACYINDAGGLTIRQERSWNEDEDTVIAIAPENVGEFIDKLTDVIGIPSFGGGVMSDRIFKKSYDPAPADPGLKPNGIRMRALTSPDLIRTIELEMQRREDKRRKRLFFGGAE